MASFWSQFKALVFIGWGIASIRFALDATAPEASMLFGVYYAMPAVLLYFAYTGTYKDVPWKRLALGMVLTGILVWGLPNLIAYTTAQFAGWGHGRFGEGRGPEIAATAMGKVKTGVKVALATSIAGSLWMIVWSTVLIWVPGRFGSGSSAESEETDEETNQETEEEPE